MQALQKAVLERKRAATGQGVDAKASRTEDSSEDESSSSEESSDSGKSGSEEESRIVLDSECKAERPVETSPTKNDTAEGGIKLWIQKLMLEWRQSLDQRPPQERTTGKVRDAEKAWSDCDEKLQPLLQRLDDISLDQSIKEHLIGIIHECNAREYRRAFDRYIQLTIGNAPWPIGVTMVGIHARSGREKIAESKVKHIMKDDVVRAYLTSFKRLMTQCQNLYPPDAPSKRMN
jgi:pre-mRNA-splicing factor 18